MKLSKQIRNSYDRANPISQLLCLYVLPFLRKNYRKEIEPDSFEPNSNCHDCDRLSGQLRKEWLRQVNSHKSPSIIRALFRTFWKTYSAMTIEHIIIYAIFRMLMPLILGRIIFHSELYLRGRTLGYAYNGNAKSSNDQLITWLGLNSHQSIIFYCVLLAVLILVNILTAQPYFMMKSRLGMRIRIALTRLIYEKAFVVTNQTVQRNTVGKIVNLISNDASRFDYMFVYFESSYMAIRVTTVAIIYLYLYIGRSAFGTLLMVLFYVPFQAIMANILTRIRTMAILLTDDRLRLMSEILPAMRVIKMYVWEKPFSRLVHLARKNEVQKIRHSMFMRSINLALFFVSSKVIALVCIILFILDDGVLSAEVVFVTLSLVNQIREVTTNMCPNGVSSGVETYISLKRIEKFLLETEIVENRLIEQEKTKIKTGIVLNNVSVKSSSDGTPILNNISFEAKHGKLTIIIGQVGSGKSSVLLSILNELPRTSGHIAINGTMIYVSQESWIFNGTVRENILFGREFNVRKYEEALKVSALVDDLKQFENGDRTMVDDRGTSLCGGQRARISLARALYTDSDCYLLDDPLSAVDASVAKHIFERCIMEYLRHKCVILVTHQLQFIKQADQIIVMKDGACHAIGSYQDLLDQGFGRFLCSATESHDDDDNNDRISAQIKAQRMRVESYTSERSNSISSYLGSIHSSVQEQPICTMNTIEEGSNRMNLSVPKQINYMKIYWIYIRAGASILLIILFFLLNCSTQILFTGTDYWLSLWTNHQEMLQYNSSNTVSTNPLISDDRNKNIIIYSIIVSILFILSIIRTITFFAICTRASVNLHNRIFGSLIRAPITFFDKTPIGIIMNRVSRDLANIDDIMPPIAFEAFEILMNCVGIFVLCMILNYMIAFPFVILIILIYFGNRGYIATARRLKRIEAAARSPLFSQLSSTLNGLSTIRSYHAEPMFIERFSKTQNRHSTIFFTTISANRLYAIFLELICVAFIYALMIIINLQLDQYNGSTIGLSISQSLLLCNSFNWGVRQYIEVETYMTSVDRIAEFCKIDNEPLEECLLDPNDNWPTNGDIKFEHVSLVYNDQSKPVLNDLMFKINSGEKIGIVGRTGAGKSSLITTLFRLIEPNGSIYIDRIKTSDISLERLRRSLSIIPQEPILFSGDIRRNLDPFNEKTDEELWKVIEKVQLKSKIKSLPKQLDSPIVECGGDFSVGQKQLICLGRAILRQNRILILDEATANVDHKTDALLQATIRNEFANCTVLTVAHRLNTIMDYDRIIVMDSGKLAQFDTPFNLIHAKEGIFYELFDSLSQDNKQELREIIRKHN